jgi:signal transduction histidine kinase
MSPVRLPQADLPPTATLREVDVRAQLVSRPRRAPDYESEARALAELADELAQNPRNMLQRLTEIALELCRADTAGLSLLEGELFRWEGVAGVYASYRNGTMPRGASPCGVCIDQGLTQLMHLPDRLFPALCAEPRFVEALLIPFAVRGQNIGTVWIVAHSEERKFDAEDERIVRTLANFAAAGWQQWKGSQTALEANERKDQFLAILGHELRNPLSAIVAAASILEKVDASRVDLIKQATEVLNRQGRHLSRMVDDLNNLARITQGKLALRLQEVEVSAVLKDAVSIASARIEQRHHRLSVHVSPRAPVIRADAVRLAQVVANLLDNAAKYTPEGGTIDLTAGQCDGVVEIRVRDSGVGIPAEKLAGIFELFTQLKQPDGPTEGLGIGLSLVDRIVRMHGGTVTAASDGPGTGSEFVVRLPATR